MQPNPNQNFDPIAFLDMPIDQVLERRAPLPARDYVAVIQSINTRRWSSKDKYDDSGNLKAGIAIDVELAVQIPQEIKEAAGLDKDSMVLKDSIMLDLNAQGGIDTSKGKNNALRRYREALDMNKPGETFKIAAMAGRMLLARVTHEEYPAGSGNLLEKIGTISKLP
jgi:hypothetical protein